MGKGESEHRRVFRPGLVPLYQDAEVFSALFVSPGIEENPRLLVIAGGSPPRRLEK
jgi:hypothetical protein